MESGLVRWLDPKDLYRRLEELTDAVFEESAGLHAVRRVAERLVEELGGELGLCGVQVPDLSPEEGSSERHVVRIDGFRQSFPLGFDVAAGARRERVELVLSALGSILSARLLQSSIGSTMRQAEEIQRSLLPQRAPRFEGFDVSVRSVPAEDVGGDLYDFLELDEDTLGLAVGDASGHGLPAALLVRDVVVGLRMGMEKDLKAANTLSRLNRVIHDSALSSCFVSVFFAELERNGNLFYFNAGHEPPLLFDAVDTRALAYGDTVIGPLANARFKRHFAHVDHGATLVLYTDGLVERRGEGDARFGVQRLVDAVRERLEEPVETVVDGVFAAADAFGAGQPWEDDATLLVVRRRP